MKYNLLPDSYTDRFNELEVDWTEMSNSKFLLEAQKCETVEKRKGRNPKRKRKQETGKEVTIAPTIFLMSSVTITKKQIIRKKICR